MANISKYLEWILKSRYGRDVRSAIHDAINAVNSSAEGSAAAAERNASTASICAFKAKVSELAAEQSMSTASICAFKAKVSELAAEQSMSTASICAFNVKMSELAAEQSMSTASVCAFKAKVSELEAGKMASIARSWAEGTDGEVREDDEVNNSRYHSLQSQFYAEQARRYCEKIEQAGYKMCGSYDDAVAYDYPDIVFFDGSSYVAKKETMGNTPGDSSEYWQIFASGLKGTIDYKDLENKPVINGVILSGNNTLEDLGIVQPDWDVSDESSNAYVRNKPDFIGMKKTVDELKKSVSDGKILVANAVTGKGVLTATDSTFGTMAENIAKIKTTPNLQNKSVTLDADTPSAVMSPDAGYDGLSQATAGISLQEKTQSLLHGSVDVMPDSGKVLSKVTVNGPADKSGVTVDAGAVTQDSDYTYFGIPDAGYYDTNSKLRSANSNIGIKIIRKYTSKPATSAAQTISLSFNVDTSPGEELTVLIFSSNGEEDKYNKYCNFAGASASPSITSHQPSASIVHEARYTLVATGNAVTITTSLAAYTSRGSITVLVIKGSVEIA